MLLEIFLAALYVLPTVRSLSRRSGIYERIFLMAIVSIPLVISFDLISLSIATFCWWVILARPFFLLISKWVTVNTAFVWTIAVTVVMFILSFNVSYRSIPWLGAAGWMIPIAAIAYLRHLT